MRAYKSRLFYLSDNLFIITSVKSNGGIDTVIDSSISCIKRFSFYKITVRFPPQTNYVIKFVAMKQNLYNFLALLALHSVFSF